MKQEYWLFHKRGRRQRTCCDREGMSFMATRLHNTARPHLVLMKAAGRDGMAARTVPGPGHGMSRRLRVAEFFSGVGAMHHALRRVVPQDLQLEVDAFDIYALANTVYAHNFGHQPRTYDLNMVTADVLDRLGAELWCLSPPCQPYTRTLNAQRRDASDPRATSLLRILEQLPLMSQPPSMLILENVEGFVGSQVHGLLKSTLESNSYHLQEFLVSPHQLGIPYLRARYFALARRQPFRHAHYNGRIVHHPPALTHREACAALRSTLLPIDHADALVGRQDLGAEAQAAGSQQAWPPCSFAGQEDIRPITASCLPLRHFLISGGTWSEVLSSLWTEHSVPLPVLAKFWRSYDVITAESTHSNCVTKNYSRTGVAAGSVVASPSFVKRLCRVDSRGRVHMAEDPLSRCQAEGQGAAGGTKDADGSCSKSLHEGSSADGSNAASDLLPSALLQELRYLTPREVANLHGFPDSSPTVGLGGSHQVQFSLPPGVSARQAYALLGNSLSVDVFAWLLMHLLADVILAP